MASDIQTNISGADAPHSDARLGEVILRTEGLTKHYGGVHALVDCNFEIRKGEHVAIMGDNGAGKSTFVRQITAVEQRTAGKIWFDGEQVEFNGPLEAREAGIETVFQTLALADHLDVPDNLFLGREKIQLQPRAVLDPRLQGHARGDDRRAEEDRREDPQHQQHHPEHVGRPAAVRRDRPHRHLPLQAHHHGRADGGARRAGDRAGREHHPHAEAGRASR